MEYSHCMTPWTLHVSPHYPVMPWGPRDHVQVSVMYTISLLCLKWQTILQTLTGNKLSGLLHGRPTSDGKMANHCLKHSCKLMHAYVEGSPNLLNCSYFQVRVHVKDCTFIHILLALAGWSFPCKLWIAGKWLSGCSRCWSAIVGSNTKGVCHSSDCHIYAEYMHMINMCQKFSDWKQWSILNIYMELKQTVFIGCLMKATLSICCWKLEVLY